MVRGESIPRRIAFINEKGGSGKTTLVANIAAYLALRRGRRVLAIDMDPQGQLGKVLGVDVARARRTAIELLVDSLLEGAGLDGPSFRSGDVPGEASSVLPILHSRIPRLDLIVANKSLALVQGSLDAGDDATDRLARALDASSEASRYDFVLMDGPPSFGTLTLNVLRAADEVVIPVPLTFLGLDGCAELMQTIRTVRERFQHEKLRVTMVIPTFYRRTRMAHEVVDRLKEHFPKELAHTVVGFHVRIDEAQSRGRSIFEYAPNDRGARAMAALAEELELRGTEAGAVAEVPS
jgi:chromosome partitioning protein